MNQLLGNVSCLAECTTWPKNKQLQCSDTLWKRSIGGKKRNAQRFFNGFRDFEMKSKDCETHNSLGTFPTLRLVPVQ